MKIVVAPNAFKGSLTATQAAHAITRGISKALPDAEIIQCPVADGGDGTAQTLKQVLGGTWIRKHVTGPLGEKIYARYLWIETKRIAIIEMAQASGLALLQPQQYNPLKTTTYGTGELIADASQHIASQIIIAIGGSATVDCGSGMAQALGAKLTKANGKKLGYGGGQLQKLTHIDLSQMLPFLKTADIIIASDVTNPLLGKHGGIQTYSPQKGATAKQTQQLETGARNFANIVKKQLAKQIDKIPGAGAAGGLGAGLITFLNAQIQPGAKIILQTLDFQTKIRDADLVITGEGTIDHQTIHGKAPAAIAQICKQQNIPCIALCGAIGHGAEKKLPTRHHLNPLPLQPTHHPATSHPKRRTPPHPTRNKHNKTLQRRPRLHKLNQTKLNTKINKILLILSKNARPLTLTNPTVLKIF